MKVGASACVVICCLTLIARVCTAGDPADVRVLDAEVRVRLQAIHQEVAAAGRFSTQHISYIRSLFAEYPDTPEIVLLYDQTLRATSDWNGLAALYSRKPVERQAPNERMHLAAILIEAKRFTDAVEILRPLHAQMPRSPVVAWPMVKALFGMGDHERAKKVLDGAWPQLMSDERWDALLLRGMIHLHDGETEAALMKFDQLLEQYPDHIPANLAMARTLNALGRGAEAQRFLDRAAAVRVEVNTLEKERARFAARLFALQDARTAKRWAECERLILELLDGAEVGQEIELSNMLRRVRALAQQHGSQKEDARPATPGDGR